MIGIIGAMQVEVDAICAKMTDTNVTTISGIDFVCGKLCGKDVVCAKCGVGKVFAAMCAQTMIVRFGADIIINTGVAGTLDSRIGIKDLAVSSACVQHDMDTTALGDERGLISGMNIVKIPADAELCEAALEAAREIGVNAISGVIASGDCFVSSSEKKKDIAETFGAIACEMEGGSVAQVCYAGGVRFVVVRSISDNADGSADIDFPEFTKAAAEISTAITLSLIKRI